MTASPSITARPDQARFGHGQGQAGPVTGGTRGLLVCGAIAGPLFVTVVVAQAWSTSRSSWVDT
jgi:hypothetical protein